MAEKSSCAWECSSRFSKRPKPKGREMALLSAARPGCRSLFVLKPKSVWSSKAENAAARSYTFSTKGRQTGALSIFEQNEQPVKVESRCTTTGREGFASSLNQAGLRFSCLSFFISYHFLHHVCIWPEKCCWSEAKNMEQTWSLEHFGIQNNTPNSCGEFMRVPSWDLVSNKNGTVFACGTYLSQSWLWQRRMRWIKPQCVGCFSPKTHLQLILLETVHRIAMAATRILVPNRGIFECSESTTEEAIEYLRTLFLSRQASISHFDWYFNTFHFCRNLRN